MLKVHGPFIDKNLSQYVEGLIPDLNRARLFLDVPEIKVVMVKLISLFIEVQNLKSNPSDELLAKSETDLRDRIEDEKGVEVNQRGDVVLLDDFPPAHAQAGQVVLNQWPSISDEIWKNGSLTDGLSA